MFCYYAKYCLFLPLYMDGRFYGIFVISGMFICMVINCVVVNTMIFYNIVAVMGHLLKKQNNTKPSTTTK